MKISIVSYLNSSPFVFGLENQPDPAWTITKDIPSECARKLIGGETDLGLVPVAALKHIPGYKVVTPYCIAADGPVDSVKLYSEVPLKEIRTVLLDYQSRTSVNLVKILAKEHWHITPEWKDASQDFESQISGTTAGVVIGDRTFALNGYFSHEYDLAEAWKSYTNLPFVFAVWASKNGITPADEMRFAAKLEYGLNHLADVISLNQPRFPGYNIREYLADRILFRLTPEMHTAMHLFLDKL